MSTGSRGISLLIWMVVFTIVCSAFLVLRYQAARLTRRTFYPDDGFVLFAFVNTIALEGVVVWAIFNGLGKHTNEVTADEIIVQFKLVVASGPTWLLGTVFIKLSVLWLYTRIFATAAFKRWARAFILVVVGYGIGFLPVFLTQCHPISQQWDPVPGGGCRDLSFQELASVSLNMVVDIAIVVLPMPVLWGLQMPFRNKIFVSIMFSIGFATIGIMAWRLQFTISTLTNTDFVYTLEEIGLISLLELWLGIIVACMPTLAPLLNEYVKPVLTKLSGRGRSGASNPDQVRLQNMGKDLNTIGSQAHRTPLKAHVYRKLGDDFSGTSQSQGELEVDYDERQLTGSIAVTTKCAYEPGGEGGAAPKEGRGGIYIRQDIKTRDVWRE